MWIRLWVLFSKIQISLISNHILLSRFQNIPRNYLISLWIRPLFTSILFNSWLFLKICEFDHCFDSIWCVFNDHIKSIHHPLMCTCTRAWEYERERERSGRERRETPLTFAHMHARERVRGKGERERGWRTSFLSSSSPHTRTRNRVRERGIKDNEKIWRRRGGRQGGGDGEGKVERERRGKEGALLITLYNFFCHARGWGEREREIDRDRERMFLKTFFLKITGCHVIY